MQKKNHTEISLLIDFRVIFLQKFFNSLYYQHIYHKYNSSCESLLSVPSCSSHLVFLSIKNQKFLPHERKQRPEQLLLLAMEAVKLKLRYLLIFNVLLVLLPMILSCLYSKNMPQVADSLSHSDNFHSLQFIKMLCEMLSQHSVVLNKENT